MVKVLIIRQLDHLGVANIYSEKVNPLFLMDNIYGIGLAIRINTFEH